MNVNIKHIVEDFDFTAIKEPDFLGNIYNEIFKKILTIQPLTEREHRLFLANLGVYNYKYVLTDTKELRNYLWMIENGPYNLRSQEGLEPVSDLNWIDVSGIKDMTKLFFNIHNYYNISEWDVSNVKHMWEMFDYSTVNWDVSNWDVSNCITFQSMFANTKNFNCDLSKWDVSNGLKFNYMFYRSTYNNDLSSWNISEEAYVESMFYECPIKNEYKPERVKTKIHKFFDKLFGNKKLE